MRTRALFPSLLMLLASCGGTAIVKMPPTDPTTSLILAGKKVDFAIAETKRMIQRSRGADYMPDLYMRLAELYTERGRYAWLVVYERQKAKGEESRSLDAPEARLLKNLAIGTYDRVLREFPKYARGDEAMFLMAHEYRELGQFDDMRSTYQKLIDTYPRSPHRLDAYLVLGDAAFDKSDLDKAEYYYNLILAQPDSHVHALARYKLGWVKVNREDCKGAVHLFEKILRDRSTPHEEKTLVVTQRSLNISREALVDTAYCYPDVYPNQPATPYFKSLAVTSSDYVAAMRRVATRFFVKQMYVQAVGALREVLSAAVSDEEAVETARKLYDNITKGKVYDRPGADIEQIGRVYEQRYYDLRVAKKSRDLLGAEFEVYARDIATRAHLQAKTTPSPAAFASAAQGYDAYLQFFGKSQARGEIEENRAEALLAAGQLYQAGKAFERVESIASAADAKKQARLNAIAAYQQALDKGGLNRLERIGARAGIRAMGRLVITEMPTDPNVINIKLSIARSYYDSGDYDHAAELFYAVAREYPTANEAVISGHLALDALRLADNLEGLAAVGRRMIADSRLGDAKFKEEIQEIVTNAEKRQVTEVTVASDGDKEAQLLSMAKRHKGSELGEQALYNALVVARSSGDINRFYELGEDFLQQYPKSRLRSDVTSVLAQVAMDRTDYTQAAQFLESAYAADPSGKEAVERLQQAASIRAMLGDNAVADDAKKLASVGAGKLDELLYLVAQAGNFTAVQDILSATSLSGPVASFLRGYFARERGDRDEAQRDLAEAARGHGEGDAGATSVAAARFLLGELVYDAYDAVTPTDDIAASVTAKKAQLAAVINAFSQPIREPRFALAAAARDADAYAHFAEFLRSLKLDALPPADRDAIKPQIDALVAEQTKTANALRAKCAEKARELLVFSDSAKSCVLNQPLPPKIAVFPTVGARRRSEPNGTAPLRQTLQKNPRSVDTLVKLAELYSGAGDVGMALLVLGRAEEIEPRNAAVHNLRGVALYKAGQFDEAYAAFNKAVQLDGSNRRARLNLAAHLAYFGYVDKAQAELRKAGGAAPSALGDPAEHPELSVLKSLGGK